MTAADRDVLIVRYLEGSAGPDEVASLNALLKSDAEARSVLREASFQALTLADLARSRAVGLRPRPAPPERRRWNVPALAAAAVLFVLATAGAVWLLRPERPLLTVVRATGAASWSAEGGSSETTIEPGMRLGPGSVTLEGARSSAELSFDDGSSVTLAGEVEVSFSGAQPKSLFLRRGSIGVEARPQPRGRPLILRTPTAEVEVVGTCFSLTAGTGRTTVAVAEGKVRLRRRVDGASTDVPGGEMAVATLDSARPLESRPIPPLVSGWRQTFDAPPGPSWQGEWVPADATGPGRLKNVLDVSYRRRDGTIVPAQVVSVREPSAITTIRPDTTLRVKWRVRNPFHGVLLLLSVQHPDGRFAGNFQTELKPDAFAADAEGWRVYAAPISSLETRYPEGARIPTPGRATLVFLACYSPTALLEIAEVAFE